MRIPWLVGLLAVMSCLSPSLFGTTLKLLSLREILTQSSRVVVGECLDYREGIDSKGLPYTQYSFRLLEKIKGDPGGKLLSIRQFGLVSDGSSAGPRRNVAHIAGMPHYQPGSTYLLFLGPVSRLGFSSPVGLAQGAFRMTGRGAGRRVANGLGNRNLLVDTSRPVREKVELRRTQMEQTGSALLPDEQIRDSVSYTRFREVLERMLSGERLDRRQLREALSEGGSRP
ncbi:MAG: hypothetical protein P8Y94_04215 [Acidobacteriota bacterium]